MCGFIGLLDKGRGDARQANARIIAGLEWLRRRGPDSQEYWGDNSTPIHLGFARLAIVDTDTRANQPYFIEENRLGIVFNGEIYNYSKLKNDLSKNYVFRTSSDTEVILAAYLEWGLAGLTRLRGMFSGAIVDLRNNRLFIFRDPVGKKPLYIYETQGELIFSSSVLAIVSASRSDTEIDRIAADEYWKFAWINPERAIIKNCRTILPGEVLEYDFDGVFQNKHSCRPAVNLAYGAGEDLIEQLHHLLEQGVTRRLLNNPHPVSLLSGGIDSTVITKMMHEHGHCEAITLSSKLPLVPDERYARYAAKKLGVPLRGLQISQGNIAESVDWALNLQDEPLGMVSFFMLAHLVAAAKEHGRILMTGDGGDEVFLGYGKAADWLAPASMNAERATWSVGLVEPSWMSVWGRWVVRQQLLGHMFTKVDRAASEQGVEIRSPLLDWDLLAWARSLPPDRLLENGTMKSLLKVQLVGWPDWFIERRKVGFAFRIRWFWAMSNYSGLRERISWPDCELFRDRLPLSLKASPASWSFQDIFRNFDAVWKLLVWSAFIRRFQQAHQ